MSEARRVFLVVRIRGSAGAPREIKDTLKMLRLTSANRAVLLPDTPSIRGMLRRVINYITWGEPEPSLLAKLLEGRAEERAGVKVGEELRRIGVASRGELAERLCRGELSLRELHAIYKPYFRLHPPKLGFRRSVKRPYADKGEYGYRGREINRLVARMI